jgi:NADH-quinone oxidoreductase subunit L
MRHMGGLRGRMKLTFGVYLIGALALAGIAPLAGFWSKDEILASASHYNLAIYIVLSLAAFLTAFYMTRQVWLIFFGQPRSEAAQHASESAPVMTLPLVVLAALAALGGALNLPGTHFLESWLEHTIYPMPHGKFEPLVALVSTVIAVAAIALAIFLYRRETTAEPLQKLPGGLFQWLADKWRVDELYELVLLHPYRRLAAWLAEIFDTRGIDGLINAIGATTREYAIFLRELQTGYVRTYAEAVLIGVVVILAFLIFRM